MNLFKNYYKKLNRSKWINFVQHKFKITVSMILFCLSINIGYSQESYSTIIQNAEKLMQNDPDSLKQKKASQLYEKAFKRFPDSINDYSLYNASLLASKFKNNDCTPSNQSGLFSIKF